MAVERTRPKRRSIRLRGYDYGQPGPYFVTICTRKRECTLGTIRDGEIALSMAGKVVAACWRAIPDHFHHVCLDEFVVMPNHVHGILQVGRRGTPWRAPTEAFGRPVRGSLPTVIRAFKASATKILIRAKHRKEFLWQRGYYEHVVRDEEELARVREYIADNPMKWDEDVDNPARLRRSP